MTDEKRSSDEAVARCYNIDINVSDEDQKKYEKLKETLTSEEVYNIDINVSSEDQKKFEELQKMVTSEIVDEHYHINIEVSDEDQKKYKKSALEVVKVVHPTERNIRNNDIIVNDMDQKTATDQEDKKQGESIVKEPKENSSMDSEKQHIYIEYLVYRKLLEDFIFKCSQGYFVYIYYKQFGCFYELRENELKVFIRKQLPPEIDKRLSEYKIKEVINRIRSCPEIQIDTSQFDRFDDLINFRNCVYDVKRKKVLQHSPNYLFTSYIDAEYTHNPDIGKLVLQSYRNGILQNLEGTYFLNFIQDITQGNKPKIQSIRQTMGYAISNYVRAKKFFIFLGKPNSGKSLLMSLLSELIGIKHTSGVPFNELGGKFQTAELLNKKLNISAEMGDAILNDSHVATIKALTGSDMIKGERKGEQPFFFQNKAKIIASGNHMTAPNKPDAAFFDRICLIAFNFSIPENKRDKSLLEKLLSERNFIIKWALDGLEELINNQFIFTESEDAIQLKNQFMDSLENINSFFREKCVVDSFNNDLKVHYKNLHPAYINYCKENCVRASTRDEFFIEVLKLGVKKGKFRIEGSDPLNGFKGIMLRPSKSCNKENEDNTSTLATNIQIP